MNESEFEELAAGYALSALSPDDKRAFEEALAAHPEWAHLVDRDLAVAAMLADNAPVVEPPSSLRSSLLSQITAMPQGDAARQMPQGDAGRQPEHDDPPAPDEVAAEPDEGGADPDIAIEPPLEAAVPARRRRVSRMWFALAASLALVLGLGAGALFVADQLNPPAAVVALDRIEAASDAQTAVGEFVNGGSATLHWSEEIGEAVLTTDSLPDIDADRAFELWYVRDGGAISAGVFDASGDSATALLSGPMSPGDIVAITVEQAGGSPEGLPTTDPILAIPTA